ncbi:MAG: hypothetical protein JNK05_30885 [Myxococcales bacterium]|nr:hypothetical protein [Myxococcales bacterium]
MRSAVSIASSVRRTSIALIAAVVVVLVASPTFAQRAHFSWTRGEGADECPSNDRAFEELEQLLRRPLGEALANRSLEALLARDAEGFRVVLYWRSSSGALLASQVFRGGAQSCEALSTAALTAALVAIESDVLPTPAETPAPPARAPTPQPTQSTPAPTPAVRTNAIAPVAPRVSGPPAPDRWRFGDLSLGGVAAFGVMPAINGGVQLYAEPYVRGRARVGAHATAYFESSYGLAIAAGFSAVEFGADACGGVLPVSWRFGIFGCAGARAGAVSGFGYNASVPTGGTQGSLAFNASGLFRLDLAPVVLSLDVGMRVNASRYVLRASGGQVLTEQSTVGGLVTLRVGVSIP